MRVIFRFDRSRNQKAVQPICIRCLVCVLPRFGGDEFLLLYSASEGEPSAFREAFTALLQANLEKSQLPFALPMRFGYAVCGRQDMTMGELVAEADRMLYEQKKVAHPDRGRQGG